MLVQADIADFSVADTVIDQWDNDDGSYVQYAWDLDKNCYSEIWYTTLQSIWFGSSTCRGKTTTVDMKGKCVTTADATNVTQKVQNYFSMFNVTEGKVKIAPDWHYLIGDDAEENGDDNEAEYDSGSEGGDDDEEDDGKVFVWKDLAENNWLFVDPQDNTVMFSQLQRTDLNKTLILRFGDGGLTDYGSSVSYYNFHFFNCPHP